jgi:hypothetical protein
MYGAGIDVVSLASRERGVAAVLDAIVDDDLERSRNAAAEGLTEDPVWGGALLAFVLFLQRRYPEAKQAADAALAESHRPEKAPLLSADYVADARAVSERRLGQAGRRLADLLAVLFPAG